MVLINTVDTNGKLSYLFGKAYPLKLELYDKHFVLYENSKTTGSVWTDGSHSLKWGNVLVMAYLSIVTQYIFKWKKTTIKLLKTLF